MVNYLSGKNRVKSVLNYIFWSKNFLESCQYTVNSCTTGTHFMPSIETEEFALEMVVQEETGNIIGIVWFQVNMKRKRLLGGFR